jgi:hypothetical protein
MHPKDLIEQLSKAPEFINWRKDRPNDILAHVFLQANNEQVGYYSKEKGTMTTFVVGKGVQVLADQEILKREEELEELALDSVKVDVDQVKAAIVKCLNTDYSKEGTMNEFIVLQMLSGKPVYNATILCRSMSAVNIRIDGETGKILEHSSAKLADFG